MTPDKGRGTGHPQSRNKPQNLGEEKSETSPRGGGGYVAGNRGSTHRNETEAGTEMARALAPPPQLAAASTQWPSRAPRAAAHSCPCLSPLPAFSSFIAFTSPLFGVCAFICLSSACYPSPSRMEALPKQVPLPFMLFSPEPRTAPGTKQVLRKYLLNERRKHI